MRQFNPVGVAGAAELEPTSLPLGPHMHAASGDRLFSVPPVEQQRDIPPGVIVQCPIVVRSQEVVQVDVEEAVARDHPPAPDIRIGFASDHHVGRTAIGDREKSRPDKVE
ncbi:hypothetical protein [Methylobacterium currus]|uniref:hypothetical protein n=1 Tax=Methylobacterium currus TaxID=2051553 RepID=UPI0013E015A8|nr:hypothetical protein [Methylobacterium currus]